MTVVLEAWIGGVSTRRVDELVQAMGLSGLSKGQVSKLSESCAQPWSRRVIRNHAVPGIRSAFRPFCGSFWPAGRAFRG